MSRRLTTPALAGVLALAIACSASADVTSQNLQLDTRVAPGSAQTSDNLTNNAYYFASVQGNFSAFTQLLWVNNPPINVVCGTPDKVMFPSAGQSANDKAGADADVLYAAPVVGGCGNFVPPIHYTNFVIDTGSGPSHREPIGGPYTTPTAGHTYSYVLKGQGAPATFRQIDASYSDNNGVYKIAVRRANGEDCKKGGWVAFGVFKNQGDCVSFFATGGKNPPANA